MPHAAARQRLHAVRAHAAQADDHNSGRLHAVEAGAGHDDLKFLGGRAAARADAQRLSNLLARTRRRCRGTSGGGKTPWRSIRTRARCRRGSFGCRGDSRRSGVHREAGARRPAQSRVVCSGRILAVHVLGHAAPFARAAKAAVSCFAFILASRTCPTLQQPASPRKKGKRERKTPAFAHARKLRERKSPTCAQTRKLSGRKSGAGAIDLRPPRLPVTKPWWNLRSRWPRTRMRSRPWTPWNRCSTRSFPSL